MTAQSKAPLIVPTLMCGGKGTRLWPLSRAAYPKQFADVLGGESLFTQTLRRLGGEGFAPPVAITDVAFRFAVAEGFFKAGVEPGAILLEPEGRNTAPAALAAAVHIHRQDPDALMLLAPTDHAIADDAAFRAALRQGVEPARQGRIVTFGITPDRPETGYGYLELGAPGDMARDLKRFVEKPDLATARRMLEAGGFLWNAGLFLVSAATLIQAFRDHAPDLIAPVSEAVTGAKPDLGFLRLDKDAWAGARSISIDYAVMERAANLSVIPFSGGWSDLGDWQAVWREMEQDATGTAVSGPVTQIDCESTLLRSESERVALVGIGLSDIVAIAMEDAVLVADRRAAQQVGEAVRVLKEKGLEQAEAQRKDYRPWGWFESLAVGTRFQVKRIVVSPGASLSLQSHEQRAEHWVVVEGTAQVTIGENVRRVSENQSVYIPVGARHRLENLHDVPLVLIEVQTGAYLGEDDIVRYDDRYARD